MENEEIITAGENAEEATTEATTEATLEETTEQTEEQVRCPKSWQLFSRSSEMQKSL